ALNHYLLIPSVSGDAVAMMKLIDLHVSQMETADARLNYLKGLVEINSLSSEVRSHAAVLASRALNERGQAEEADQMLEDALKLNPLNTTALRMKYQRVRDTGTDQQRMAALVSVIRANPAQPSALGALARELAQVGLVDQSITWFSTSFDVSQRTGVGLDPF